MLKEILSIIAIILGAGGSILTLYTIKLIKVKDLDAFTAVGPSFSKNADPTPALRKRLLYDPHNKKMMCRFKFGIAFIILGALIQISIILFF